MEKRSIAFRLSLYIILVVSIVISIIVFLNYKYSEKFIMQHIDESAVSHSSQITSHIAHYVISTQEISKNVAAQATYYLSHNDLEIFLKNIINSNEILNGIHLNIENPQNGQIESYSAIRTTKDSIILSTEPNFCFHKEAFNVKDKEWSSPFYCERHDSTLLMSYHQEVFSPQGIRIGELTSEISLDFLNKLVAEMKFGKNGFSFILDNHGNYITHPNREWVMNRNVFDTTNEISSDSINVLMEHIRQDGFQKGIIYPESLNYEKSWFYTKLNPQTGWFITTVIPFNELFHDLKLILREIIWISSLGILFLLVTIILLFRKLLSPLMRLIRSIQKYNKSSSLKNKSQNEIELLNDSLNSIQDQYQRYQNEKKQSKKDKRKHERDLKSAKEIQMSIIPASESKFVESKHIDIYAELHPAESIGGDLYDYFFIDSNHILITMGDVSGKGIPAALFMAVAHTLMKSKANIISPSQIMKAINDELSKQNVNQHFLTLFLGVLNINTGELKYCNAAHNYPYVIRDESEIEVLDVAHGLPLGIYPNKTYTEDFIILNSGDSIVLYTDGVTDCKDRDDQSYGVERFFGNISSMLELAPKEIVKRMMKSLKLFKGDVKQADDISLLVLRYLNSKEKSNKVQK